MAREIIFVNNDTADWVLDELDGRVVPAGDTLDVSSEITDDEMMHAIQTGLGASFKDDPQGRFLRINGVDKTAEESANYGNLAEGVAPAPHAIGGTDHTPSTLANLNTKISDGNLDFAGTPRPPTAHAPSHQLGGSDVISVAGLSGLLATAQTPIAHKDTHKSGGTDAFLTTDLIEAIVKRIRESGGPTDLLIGAIANGAGLKRSGSTIIGDPGMSYRCWASTFGSNTAPGFNSGSTTPVVIRIKTFPGTNIFGTPIRACTVAMSSSGGPGFVEIYRPSNGTIIATIGPITATTPTVYEAVPPWTNPWPTTEEPLEIRVYRGGTATTMTIYDLTAGIY